MPSSLALGCKKQQILAWLLGLSKTIAQFRADFLCFLVLPHPSKNVSLVEPEDLFVRVKGPV